MTVLHDSCDLIPILCVLSENMGKIILSGPIKPNEPIQPMKKKLGETKKSFLSNAGKALQSTPVRQVFSPRAVNVGTFIYNDADVKGTKDTIMEELEFTKPRKYCGEQLCLPTLI